VCDRVDFSGCSETLLTDSIDMEKFIINMDDLAKLHDEVIVLMSRYKACITRVFFMSFINRILVQHMDRFKDQAKM